MWLSIAALSLLGLFLGVALGLASKHLAVEGNPLAQQIEAMLPGSQCAQCGFAGCAQAATAIAEGHAAVTACPPGGHALAVNLAALLGVELSAGDDDATARRVARVDDAKCIGCTKCFQACPTDAIVGAPKQMHAVLAEYCTSCSLCVDVCPTETIRLEANDSGLESWRWPKPRTKVAA